MNEIDLNEKMVNEIGIIIKEARNNVARKVNNELLNAYWNIGRVIVEDELKKERGEYGKKQLIYLSRALTKKFGKGFSRQNIQRMKILYEKYPICSTLSSKLNWSHYVELLSIEND